MSSGERGGTYSLGKSNTYEHKHYRGYMLKAKSTNWETPDRLFDNLNKKFHFTLEVCASSNPRCKIYYDKDSDGLKQPWSGRVFVNPPYGPPIRKWLEKALEELPHCEVIVMLLPVRTDTKWFHELVLKKAKIRFLKGRLHFGNIKNSAPFPSMVVIFRESGNCTISSFNSAMVV